MRFHVCALTARGRAGKGGGVILALSVLSVFGLAFIAPGLTRRAGNVAGWVLAILPATLTLYFASLLPLAAAEQPAAFSIPWSPELGLFFSFRADGLGLLFALLISGVGTLVIIYAGGYLKGHPNLDRFYAWLLVFMGAMLGLALADNMLLLFVFWELTSFSSYMLIGFDHERPTARAAAQQAFLITAGGGLALLAGLLLLGQAGGTLEFSALLRQGDVVRASPFYLPAVLLILLGAFTKSAQFPFHFWLPNAMEAPTPVSAYLHSATMVKAGVYLLARLGPVLNGTDLWLYAVGGVGAVTMLVGGYLALLQTDLKRLLAYSTVSALGMLTLLIGLGSPHALEAAVVLLLAHGLYKGALFLVAGVLDHETGTRDITQLGGLFPAMKLTAIAGGLAALSMAGLPPLFGFISKELSYEAALESGPLVTAGVVLAGLLFVFVAGTAGVAPFWGGRRQTPKSPHEAPVSMWVGLLTLAALSLLVGIFPAIISAPLISPAVSSAIGEPTNVTLALWHGLNPAFLLSVATVVLGVGMFAARNPLRHELSRLAWRWGPSFLYDRALDGLDALSRGQTRLLQSGYLRYYLMTLVIVATGLVGFTLFTREGWNFPQDVTDIRFFEVALGVLILGAAFVATIVQSRLAAVALLGVVGYGVSLIYILFGAPDLAMTQFLIESLTVILFVLAFYHLPQFTHLSSRGSRVRDILIALLAGGLMTALVLSATGILFYPSISDFFVENSLPLGHGRNIVNVILVDFRAFDTMGEITVLGIAAIGVYVLLKLSVDSDSDKEAGAE
ncbi:MAG TPA: putative monovalent cation/H+ antiporter subunit A [Anaerolineales bacterium]|nr:putative monovalent cation/H+ antiporter subunit A [Anaerolineales bacterium]